MRARLGCLLWIPALCLALGTASAQTAKERELQGRAYLAAQRWDDAIVELKAALDAEPDRVAILFALARAYEGKGDDQLALDTYARYPENGPDGEEAKTEIARLTAVIQAKSRQRAEAHAVQAKAFHDNGAYDQAVAEYLEAFRLQPSASYYFLAGQSYEAKGDKRKAIELYQRYVDAEPSGSYAATALPLIARLHRDVANETTAGAKKAEAAIAAGQARDAADAARRAGQQARDAARAGRQPEVLAQLAAGRAASEHAAAAADRAGRAAAAADEAGRGAGTDEARKEAEEAGRLAEEARKAASDARVSTAKASRLAEPTAPAPAERREAARPGRGLRWAGGGALVAGGACLVAAAVSGVQASNRADEVSSAEGQWTPALDQAIDDGEAAERRMYVLYGVGGALVGAGVALTYLGWRGGAEEVDAQALRWTPVVGARSAGLAVGGRF